MQRIVVIVFSCLGLFIGNGISQEESTSQEVFDLIEELKSGQEALLTAFQNLNTKFDTAVNNPQVDLANLLQNLEADEQRLSDNLNTLYSDYLAFQSERNSWETTLYSLMLLGVGFIVGGGAAWTWAYNARQKLTGQLKEQKAALNKYQNQLNTTEEKLKNLTIDSLTLQELLDVEKAIRTLKLAYINACLDSNDETSVVTLLKKRNFNEVSIFGMDVTSEDLNQKKIVIIDLTRNCNGQADQTLTNILNTVSENSFIIVFVTQQIDRNIMPNSKWSNKYFIANMPATLVNNAISAAQIITLERTRD